MTATAHSPTPQDENAAQPFDWDSLAEAERASPALKKKYRLRCPSCEHAFTVKSASSNVKVTCPECGDRFPLRQRRLRPAAKDEPVPELIDTCIYCGRPTDAGRTSCDRCASERRPTIEAEDDDGSFGLGEKGQFLGGVLLIGCGVVGIAVSATLFALLEASGIEPPSREMKLAVGVGIGGMLWQWLHK